MGQLSFRAVVSRHKYTLLTLLFVSSFAVAAKVFDDIVFTGDVTFNAQTATTVPYLDASKNLVSSDVTPTELDYLDGVTSAIQTQLDSKIDSIGSFGSTPNSNGLSISSTAINLQPASASNPGAVSTGTQAFGGAKEFSTVGVGVAAGTGSLKVQANGTNYDSALSLLSSNGTKKVNFYPENNGYFYFLPDGLTIFPWMVDNTGKLGVGTGSPEAQLTVGVPEDIVQLSVKSHSTQTNNLIQTKDTSGTIVSKVEADGDAFWTRVFAGTGLAFTNSSVGLELKSTSLAFLPSRMTAAQRDALTGSNGMLVYNTDTNKFNGYQNGSWSEIGGGSGGSAGINMMLTNNYNFEDASESPWTESGSGTLTVTSTAANVANGTYALSYDAAAASDYATSGAITIPSGLYSQSCLLQFYAKGFDSNITFQVHDGTNVVASKAVSAAYSTYAVVSLNFICPSSGTLEMRISAGADAAIGYVDEIHLGSAINVGQMYGPLNYSATIANDGTVTLESPIDWINGNCTNADPRVCTLVSGIFTATPNCTTDGEDITAASSSSVSVDQNAVTSRLNCMKTGADATSAQTAFRADTVANSWSGYHDNTCSWGVSSASYTDPTADSSCALVQRTNSNFGTVTTYTVTNPMPGIVFTPSRAGRYYACANFTWTSNGTSGTGGFALVNDSTIVAERDFTNHTDDRTMELCGIIVASSTASKTIKIHFKMSTGTNTIFAAGQSVSAIEWQIFQIDQSSPAPHITQSVVSPYSGVLNICSGYITNSGTPAVSRSDGGCVTSVTDNGTGDNTLNFAAGTFSSAPNCTCTPGGAAGVEWLCVQDETTTPTASLVRLQTTSISGTDNDANFFFICIGPK